jgi:TrmH family RNA methyltransferase
MITSVQNPKVKYVHALQTYRRFRKEQNAFVVEGIRLVEEAWSANWEASLVFFTEGLNERGETLLAGFSDAGTHVLQVSPQVMRAVSDTQHPQGLLGVLPVRSLSLPNQIDFVLVPDQVRDPGNMGTILRTALAAGVDAVFLPPGSVDVYAPKVVRAAMGAHFHLPMRNITWQEIAQRIKRTPLKVYLADSQAERAYSQVDFKVAAAIIVGGEAEGAGEAARNLADEHIQIPMPGGTESLNAAVATAILLFEVVRQRSIDL